MALAVAVSIPAQEPSLQGRLRHQLGVTVDDAEIVRNVVTAELEIGYRAGGIDLLMNPYIEIMSDSTADFGVREAYLDYYTDRVDFRVGKQIVIWGKADGLAITDIVSPKDLRNFLIPDFRELRLGVIAANASIYLGPAVVEFIYVPVFTPSVLPAPGSIWYTTLETPIEPTINPAPAVGSRLDDGEFYGRLRLQTGAVDIDIAGGYYWTNEPSPTITKQFSSPGVLSALTVSPEHYRQALVGGAISSSVGPFILRGESGFFTPKRLITTDMANVDGYVEKNYLQTLAGADTALAGVDLSAQLMHQYVLEHEQTLRHDEHTWTATFRARTSFLREQLVFDAFTYVGFNAPDALVKFGATWAPVDAFSFRAEANLFFGDEGQFGAYRGNDLVVISTRYSF
ncbi:MAG: hypothetical protein EA426_01325 [Spirochaetaceae bacterium]|nr:MAG: hypothetical protein EA426_01325 [Spirochaetaceae bacterium]